MILLAALIAAGAPAERLQFGSSWHCVSPFADRAEVDFSISHAEPGKPPKKLSISKAVGGLAMGLTGYSSDHADKNSVYDAREAKRNPVYLYAEYIHGFYDNGLEINATWKASDPTVDLSVHTFDWQNRSDPTRRNEKSYGFKCQSVSPA